MQHSRKKERQEEMNYVESYIVLIDLINWTNLFVLAQDDAINRLIQFQRQARTHLEGDNYLSYVVTFADNVWARSLKSTTTLSDLLDKTMIVIDDAKNDDLIPWCVVTSGLMAFDTSDQVLTTGSNITDIRSQHISGIGDAQIRAACAAKTKKLSDNVVWLEKQLYDELEGNNYAAGLSINLSGNSKWPFRNRTEFIPLTKRESR